MSTPVKPTAEAPGRLVPQTWNDRKENISNVAESAIQVLATYAIKTGIATILGLLAYKVVLFAGVTIQVAKVIGFFIGFAGFLRIAADDQLKFSSPPHSTKA